MLLKTLKLSKTLSYRDNVIITLSNSSLTHKMTHIVLSTNPAFKTEKQIPITRNLTDYHLSNDFDQAMLEYLHLSKFISWLCRLVVRIKTQV